MNKLVIAATQMEIQPLMSAHFEADFLITGVGTPTTVYNLLKKIAYKQYDFILQVGVAGSFKEFFKLGDVVFVKSDCFADLGAIENKKFHSIFDLNFNGLNEFPFKKGMLENEFKMQLSLKEAKGITVNCLTDEMEQIGILQGKYQADVESMEGAALHFVCLQEGIPFLQIRGISNFVGERDKSEWQLKSAIINSNRVALKIIESM